jgi:exodeoxyribonuclease III
MLIISWNVAGLSTTVNRIHDRCQPTKNADSSNSKKKHPPSAALLECLKRHKADILCLQEHKIPLSQLSARSEPRGCSTIDGYESFWSCCVDKNKCGFNGVVTYVKSGMVVSADSAPLGSPDLDEQGRCIMTDHGDFVVFNVYVPALGGQTYSYKMKFLQALHCAMHHQRTNRNKAVILVGDLNTKHTKRDVFWKDRAIFVLDIMEEVAAENISSKKKELPSWKDQLAEAWPKIENALETKEVVSTTTVNSRTNQKYDKYRLCVVVDGRRVFLGSHESSPDYCTYRYDFRPMQYTCSETDEKMPATEGDAVCVGILAELMMKICFIEWDEKTQRMISETAAREDKISPTRKWLNAVVEEDGMVDAFRHFYPTAEGRYTCWNQFTNRRYFNEGVRIDYTLVDSCLMQHVQKGDVDTLRCCSSQEDPMSEGAALCAATANGRFQPVSFEGGGMIEPSQEAIDTQFGEAHTGMIYTPPSFSDHIAISLLLDDICTSSELVLDEKDSATKKAQPHKSQKSIASFFGSAATTNGSNAATKPAAINKPLAVTAPKRKGIQNFFSARTKSVDNEADPAKRIKVAACTKCSYINLPSCTSCALCQNPTS